MYRDINNCRFNLVARKRIEDERATTDWNSLLDLDLSLAVFSFSILKMCFLQWLVRVDTLSLSWPNTALKSSSQTMYILSFPSCNCLDKASCQKESVFWRFEAKFFDQNTSHPTLNLVPGTYT